MAVNSRYIQYYTPGSAAEKLMPALPEENRSAPKKAKRNVQILYLDPVMLLGVATAVCLMVCMFVGLGIYNQSCQEYAAMDNYVYKLERQNQELTENYKKGYDLEEIRLDAVLMGYVPESEVAHVTIHVPAQEQAPQQNFFKVLLSKIFS